jgi:hypothetical protein
MKQRINLSDYPTLFYQSGLEYSQLFIMNFLSSCRHFVMRLTGGCEMSDEDAAGLTCLEEALSGHSPDSVEPYFTGFGIYGGTRYKEMTDPENFIPGITEVFPKIAHQLPEAILLGIVGKTNPRQRYTPWGIVIDENEVKGRFTVIHPTAKSLLVLQPSVDRGAPWDSEYLESYRISDELYQAGWDSLLVVYNGGGIVEKEICLWAERGKKVLIVRGSGRKADEYANNQSFLAEHPNVHVAEKDTASIRAKLLELGALTYPHAGKKS